MIRGAGFDHEGSRRAEKTVKEDSNAALEHTLVRDLVTCLPSRQHLNAKPLRRARFEAVIWPLTETSTEKLNTE